jgi:hypothetical protein
MTLHTAILNSTARHDGWTPARRTQFLDHLAGKGSVRAACARVGMSREAAYRLRRREALFARGWDAALVLARAASAEELADRALDGVEEEIWYRGELVGTRRKYDNRLLLAHIARLDRIADNPLADHDAARFDEILAIIGGEAVPAEIACTDSAMPQDREDHVASAVEDAGEAFDQAWAADHPEDGPPSDEEDDDDSLDPLAAAERQERENSLDEAYREALAERLRGAQIAAEATWDAWQDQAHAAADRLLTTAPGAESTEPCTLSELSTSGEPDAGDAPGQDGASIVQPVSPSPSDEAHAAETAEPGKPERAPRYEDFAASPTSWLDYRAARKAHHQKQLARQAAQG